MGIKEREAITDYLVEELRSRGSFSSISPHSAFNYDIPEEKRCISLERGRGKFLIAVHSDANYKGGQKSFSAFLRFLTQKEGVACVSVFDDSVFYNWDQGIFKPSRRGSQEQIRKRIKLLGLERQAQELGPLTYYKQQRPRLEVVKFTGGVVADYSGSQRTPDWIKERELLTVMDAEVLETLTQFDLGYERDVKGVRVAKFIAPRPVVQEYNDIDEGVEYNLDERLEFAFQELQSGNDEPYQLLSAAEQKLIDRHL